MIFGKPLATLYSPKDPLVVKYAIDRMTIILPIYFVCGVVEVIVGCLRGMNRPIVPMIPSFLCVCVFRIIWVYTICKKIHTTTILYLSYPISWILNIIIDIVLFIIYYHLLTRPALPMRIARKTAIYAPYGGEENDVNAQKAV